jgi:hypothetical protein
MLRAIVVDRQIRAKQLLELEEVEARIHELRDALRHAGQILAALGASLSSSPESTTFANAPPPLGHMPLQLMHSRAYDWNSIPDKATVAQKIQDLRELHERRAALHARLHQRG